MEAVVASYKVNVDKRWRCNDGKGVYEKWSAGEIDVARVTAYCRRFTGDGQPPICAGDSNKIRLSRKDGSPNVSSSVLGRVRPLYPGTVISTEQRNRPYGIELVAQVFDSTGNVVPNIEVTITSTVIARSGGHAHHDERRDNSYAGDFIVAGEKRKELKGNTGANGLVFIFQGTPIAGDHKLIAKCGTCDEQQGADTVQVGFFDFVEITPSDAYGLIGETDNHQRNHFGTTILQSKLLELAKRYNKSFPSAPMLQYNDMSLERGGKFDVSEKFESLWNAGPHVTHRTGWNVDVRANSKADTIPPENRSRFEEIVRGLRGSAQLEDDGKPNAHYHLNFLP